MIQLKRAYEPAEPSDGKRVLVDQFWPRGITKDKLQAERWEKAVAPSKELCKWFGHDPARWDEFQRRYRQELGAPDKQAMIEQLARESREGRLTLVYGARDTEHNQAVVLRSVIETSGALVNHE